MKTPINDGGPAFPSINDHTHPTTINNGMTLRDYFAGQAMASLLVNRKFNEASTKDIVERAFWFADAMLDERMEEPK
tara:strand:+ start:275 stop:505 length:231 start_codon:yes stop_codon:yes gene_type:complete